jgi:hypothetical protein
MTATLGCPTILTGSGLESGCICRILTAILSLPRGHALCSHESAVLMLGLGDLQLPGQCCLATYSTLYCTMAKRVTGSRVDPLHALCSSPLLTTLCGMSRKCDPCYGRAPHWHSENLAGNVSLRKQWVSETGGAMVLQCEPAATCFNLLHGACNGGHPSILASCIHPPIHPARRRSAHACCLLLQAGKRASTQSLFPSARCMPRRSVLALPWWTAGKAGSTRSAGRELGMCRGGMQTARCPLH